jgi:hypothetical protein
MSSGNKKRMRFGIALNAAGALIGFVGGALKGLTILYAVGVIASLMTVAALWIYLRAPLLPDSF